MLARGTSRGFTLPDTARNLGSPPNRWQTDVQVPTGQAAVALTSHQLPQTAGMRGPWLPPHCLAKGIEEQKETGDQEPWENMGVWREAEMGIASCQVEGDEQL